MRSRRDSGKIDGATPQRRRLSSRTTRRRGQQLLAGALTGVVVLAVTRWVVLAVVARPRWSRSGTGSSAVLATSAPRSRASRDSRPGSRHCATRSPARSGSSRRSRRPPINAAPSVRPSLNLLVDRLRVREPLPDALMKFSEDLDDPSADLVVAALILNARLRGPGLRDVLTALSGLGARRARRTPPGRVEPAQHPPQRPGRRRRHRWRRDCCSCSSTSEYVKPYGTRRGPDGAGRACLRCSRLSVFWLRSLSGVSEPERFLDHPHDEGAGRMILELLAGASVGVGIFIIVVRAQPSGARCCGDPQPARSHADTLAGRSRRVLPVPAPTAGSSGSARPSASASRPRCPPAAGSSSVRARISRS